MKKKSLDCEIQWKPQISFILSLNKNVNSGELTDEFRDLPYYFVTDIDFDKKSERRVITATHIRHMRIDSALQ